SAAAPGQHHGALLRGEETDERVRDRHALRPNLGDGADLEEAACGQRPEGIEPATRRAGAADHATILCDVETATAGIRPGQAESDGLADDGLGVAGERPAGARTVHHP